MKLYLLLLCAALFTAASPVRADSDVEDISDVWSVNSKGHPANETIELGFAADEIVSSISFNLTGIINPSNVGSLGGSWASDALIRVYSSDGKVDFTWHPWPSANLPGATSPASAAFSGTGGLPWTVPHGGADLTIEFYESYDDDPNKVDGILMAGSTMTLIYDSHPDSDHDGMPDTWEDTVDLIVGVNDGQDDPDHDGIVNLLEYAFDSNPHVFFPGIAPVAFLQDDHLNLTYIRHKSELDVLLIPEVSHNLVSWQSGSGVIEEVGVISRDERTEWVTVREKALAGSSAHSYMRLKVQHVP